MSQGVDSVRIVIFDESQTDNFLVITEADDPDNWKLVGGKFEGDETPDQAAARELIEEVALGADEVALIQAAELLNDDGVSKRYIYTVLADRRKVSPSAEIAQTAWVTEDTVPEGKNHSHILSAVAAARASLSN